MRALRPFIAALAVLLVARLAVAGQDGKYVPPEAYQAKGPELTVVQLYIGQGDAAFLRLPNGKTALIDGGGTPSWSKLDYEPGREKVVPFLEAEGVQKLDYVVISHPHGDHIAGLLEVFRRFPVDVLIDPALEHDEPEYAELLKLAKARNADYQVVGEGDTLDWDPALKIEVFGPPRDFAYPHLNDNSVVLRIAHGEVAFLFPGDAEVEAEDRLARRYKGALKAHVLKAGHHGSKTSSSPRFLDAVQPETVVISCGRNNLFRHPHRITLSRLSARGIQLFRTDEDGDVRIRSDGASYTVETEE